MVRHTLWLTRSPSSAGLSGYGNRSSSSLMMPESARSAGHHWVTGIAEWPLTPIGSRGSKSGNLRRDNHVPEKRLLANYASQIYVTVIGIVMVSLYIKYMGTEAHGLIGFFAMLQAGSTLLDMGLTPTTARETARFRRPATDALSLRRLLR